MIDTMTIYHIFNNYNEYMAAFDTVKDCINKSNNNAQLHRKKNTNEKITYAFAACGIEEMYFTQNISYIIYLKIRPKLMTEPGNYDDVLRAYDVPKLCRAFCLFMRNIGLNSLSDIKKWRVKRIDYAVDIVINQNLIPIYINLFNKGNTPESMLNNKVSLAYKETDNNLYLASKNIRVNFYDRYTTALAKKKIKPDKYSDVHNRYGILRFEVQLRDINTSKLKKSKKIQNNTVHEFMSIDMCREYILRYYTSIIGKGDYIEYYAALCKCRSKTQADMIKLIHDEGSVCQAKMKYINNSGDKRKRAKKFSEIINKLERIGINPVTLKAGTLKNLYDEIVYAIDGSNKILIRRRTVKNEA